MKVEIHDLRHEKWFVEAAENTTIAELKSQNAIERKLDAGSNQKLIFSGKILKDTDTLAGIKYAEGKGFIVCMVSKSRKATPTPKKATPSPEPAASSSGGASTTEPTPPATDNQEDSRAASTEPEAVSGPSAFATGDHLQTVTNNIVEMGYSQPQVILAMRRAFNNPDRAVEYLVSGEIPEIPEAPEGSVSEDAATAEGSPAVSAPAESPEEDSQRDISSIDRNLFDSAEHEEPRGPDFQQLLGLNDEQLEQLRAAVQRDPGSVMRIIEPVVRTHPELAHLLSVHLDDFVRFLHNVDEIDEDDDDELAALASGRQVTIEITPEEDAAISRLMELGFDRQVVATAFIICDKDEQLTANYLFEHGADD